MTRGELFFVSTLVLICIVLVVLPLIAEKQDKKRNPSQKIERLPWAEAKALLPDQESQNWLEIQRLRSICGDYLEFIEIPLKVCPPVPVDSNGNTLDELPTSVADLIVQQEQNNAKIAEQTRKAKWRDDDETATTTCIADLAKVVTNMRTGESRIETREDVLIEYLTDEGYMPFDKYLELKKKGII